MPKEPFGEEERRFSIPTPGVLADRLGVSAAAVVFGVIGVIAAALGGWWALRPSQGPSVQEILAPSAGIDIPIPSNGQAATAAGSSPNQHTNPAGAGDWILVHVDGAVVSPGVHQLQAGSRVLDAVEAAGGLSADADGARLNLAEMIGDGARLWVPSVGDDAVPEVVNPSGGSSGSSPADGAAGVTVNINTADEARLESLPGIGPSLAAAIVEHRQNIGPFARVQDLEKVAGIGPAKLEKILPMARV